MIKIYYIGLIFLVLPLQFVVGQPGKSGYHRSVKVDTSNKQIIPDSFSQPKGKIKFREHQYGFRKGFVDNDSDGINDNRCRGFSYGQGCRKGRR